MGAGRQLVPVGTGKNKKMMEQKVKVDSKVERRKAQEASDAAKEDVMTIEEKMARDRKLLSDVKRARAVERSEHGGGRELLDFLTKEENEKYDGDDGARGEPLTREEKYQEILHDRTKDSYRIDKELDELDRTVMTTTEKDRERI